MSVFSSSPMMKAQVNLYFSATCLNPALSTAQCFIRVYSLKIGDPPAKVIPKLSLRENVRRFYSLVYASHGMTLPQGFFSFPFILSLFLFLFQNVHIFLMNKWLIPEHSQFLFFLKDSKDFVFWVTSRTFLGSKEMDDINGIWSGTKVVFIRGQYQELGKGGIWESWRWKRERIGEDTFWVEVVEGRVMIKDF